MRNRRKHLVAALSVMLGALPAGPAAGQSTTRPLGWLASRPALEASYTRLRFDGDGGPVPASGVGARLMWNLAPDLAREAGLRARTDVGLYTAVARQRAAVAAPAFSSVAAGVAADVRPFAAPLAGRLDPFVSLGAGALRTDVRGAVPAPRALRLGDGRPVAQFAAPPAPPSPLLGGSHTAFTLTPGVGLRVPLTPALAAQGDVRNLLTFRDGARSNWAMGAGLRFGF